MSALGEAEPGMAPRVLTALLLAPAVIALVWFGPPWLVAAVAALVTILALLEFLRLGEHLGLEGFRNWTILCAALIFGAQYALGLGARIGDSPIGDVMVEPETFSIASVLLLFLFGAAAIIMRMKRPLQEALPAISVSSAGLLFIALPFSFLVRLDEFPERGKQLVLFTLCLVWAGDIVAYLVGRSLGRLKLAPALSPKKTWEGAAANVAASLLVAYAFARWMQADVASMLIVAAAANLAGQAGDLLESSYKRGAAVKDSSALLPGHGGMLDRIDSLILAVPVVWLLFAWSGTRIVAR